MIDDDTDWSLIDFTPPKPEPVAKGACPKCGKHIGKGLHMHEKSCNGNPSSSR